MSIPFFKKFNGAKEQIAKAKEKQQENSGKNRVIIGFLRDPGKAVSFFLVRNISKVQEKLQRAAGGD